MTDVIVVPGARDALESIGFKNKKRVSWATDPRGVDGKLKPGYILSDQISDHRDPTKSPPRLNLEEAYPSAVLFLKYGGEMIQASIWGLPDDGLDGIDFTHYRLGHLVDITINRHFGESYGEGFCPISFYREESR
ncbi:hypothetical protein J4477_03715 [Candidatus Pacearchaeota archaeon]|nr:hypothetical protein [Candidatus Pacearchaeota archaeon]